MRALVRRGGTRVCMASAALLVLSSCGRTDPLWWTDIYASDTGTEDAGDGDGDGDSTSDSTPGTSTSTTDPTTTTDTDTDTDTTDTTTTDTDTTDTDPTTTTDTDTTDTDPTTTTDTDTTTTDSTTTDTTDTDCMDVPIALSQAPTRVLLLLDQGAHMGLQFGGMTRWEAIGEALFGMQAGAVWAWEASRLLGMLSYTSNNGNQGGQCPIAELVPMALQSGADMQFAFAGLNPADDNPTGDAITLALGEFGGEPGQLILLTGRIPDSCANAANNGPAATATIAAAEAAFAAGVSTRVVAVGDLNATFAAQLANVGAGLPAQTPNGAPYWAPQDVDQLAANLDELLQDAAGCELETGQALPPDAELQCYVDLDGQPLVAGDPQGWSASGSDRITINGTACDMLAQGAMPSMICVCEAFQP